MSIYNDAGAALVESIALQFDTELNNQFVSDGLPPGRFMLFDNEARGETYSREDFGVRASLVWSDEV